MIHYTFSKHLHVQSEDRESSDEHHQFYPNQKNHYGGDVMLPLGHCDQIVGYHSRSLNRI